ncbi:MAG: hypothetical protein MUO53_00960 [Maribacter sp.]|nr:hypothetical protein [Maribacter sp.]
MINTIMNMPTTVLKTFRTSYWVFLPFLLIANTDINQVSFVDTASKGGYLLHSKGVLNKEIKGDIRFEINQQKPFKGDDYSTLKLQFWNHHLDHNFMELQICLKGTTQEIKRGKYEVSQHIEGFSNYFDGVFAFANDDILGERPFFSEKGSVTISGVADGFLSGSIKVTMGDFHGNSFEVHGNFMAMR